jgi:hypothetical protein
MTRYPAWVIAPLLLAATAYGDINYVEQGTNSGAPWFSGGHIEIQVPYFNPALGTLNDVKIRVDMLFGGTLFDDYGDDFGIAGDAFTSGPLTSICGYCVNDPGVLLMGAGLPAVQVMGPDPFSFTRDWNQTLTVAGSDLSGWYGTGSFEIRTITGTCCQGTPNGYMNDVFTYDLIYEYTPVGTILPEPSGYGAAICLIGCVMQFSRIKGKYRKPF